MLGFTGHIRPQAAMISLLGLLKTDNWLNFEPGLSVLSAGGIFHTAPRQGLDKATRN